MFKLAFKPKVLVIIGLCLGLLETATLPLLKAQADSTQSNVYRLYNPNTGEHFYTVSSFEQHQLIQAGWTSEGVGWVAPKKSKTSVYRVYNPHAKGGDHYYTKSLYEARRLVKKGWRWDNKGKAVFYSGGTKAIQVAFNPNAISGSHNYTTNSYEQKNLLKLGWKYGATAFYGQTWINPPAWKQGVQRYYTIPGIDNTVFGNNILDKKNVTPLSKATIGLSAEMSLKGSGRGYHGKLMIGDLRGNNVSFGIQYDAKSGLDNGQWAKSGVYLSENIANGGVHDGGSALYVTYGPAPLNQVVKLGLSYDEDQQLVAFYVNDHLVGSQDVQFNAGPSSPLAILNQARTGLTGSKALYMVSAQGATALGGDKIDTQFKKIVVTGLPIGYQDWVATPEKGGLNWWNILAQDYFSTYSSNGISQSQGIPKEAQVDVRGRSTLPSGYDWDHFPSPKQPTGGIQIPVGEPDE